MTISPEISIIIPNYNGRPLLPSCINSIYLQSYMNFSIVLVDNGSSDGSVDLIRRDYPQIHLISFDENKGFSSAVNAGIQHSEAPWIFLLNNDTELAPDCLESLIQAAELYPEIYFFAPKMLNFYHRDILDGAGDGLFVGGAGYRIGTVEYDGPDFDRIRPVFGACAGAAFYKREFFDLVGLFDESFFAYLEDVDINLRAVRLGLECLYVPSAKIYHMGSQTTGSRLNPFIVSHTTTNSIHMIIKNYPMRIILKKWPEILIYHAWWFFVATANSQLFAYLDGLKKALHQLPEMLKNRKQNLHLVLSEKELLFRMMYSQDEVLQSILRRRIHSGRSQCVLRLYMKVFCLKAERT